MHTINNILLSILLSLFAHVCICHCEDNRSSSSNFIFILYVLTVGARDVFKVKSPDEVFDTLERLLWDHANKVKQNFSKVKKGKTFI